MTAKRPILLTNESEDYCAYGVGEETSPAVFNGLLSCVAMTCRACPLSVVHLRAGDLLSND
jgi:hypothetical protein